MTGSVLIYISVVSVCCTRLTKTSCPYVYGKTLPGKTCRHRSPFRVHLGGDRILCCPVGQFERTPAPRHAGTYARGTFMAICAGDEHHRNAPCPYRHRRGLLDTTGNGQRS